MSARKKSRKFRGSKTHGYGSKKKHRGSGSKGGKGHAGSHKHKIHHYIKYEPEHFGKRGFRSVQQRFGKKLPAINIDDVEKIAKEAGTTEIDISALGYGKLLGRGEISTALEIKAPSASKSAIEKVEKAGGKVVLND